MLMADLEKQLKDILEGIGIQNIEPVIERSSDLKNGDYSTNIALIAFKQYQVAPARNATQRVTGASSNYQEFKTPLELAQEIVRILNTKYLILHTLGRAEAVQPGFINFWISKEELGKKVNTLLEDKEEIADKNKDKKVIVEYSSPNIAKPFTIGHLRSTIIGDAIANLLDYIGFKVYRDSHVGDWGTQFGKQIYAIKKWGNEAEIEKSDDPVKILVELYIRFHSEAEKDVTLEDEAREWFKKLEDGDLEARRLWQKCIDWSWKEFDHIYKKLGVTFTENEGRGYGESYFEGRMLDIIDELKEKKLLKIGKEGAEIVEYDEATKLPPLMILKKDGATLYSTRDLATDKFRMEKYGKDISIINEVGAEQSLYFQQLYKLEEMLEWYSLSQRVHVRHGLYRFKDEKMSTRRGNVIWLEDVLSEAISRARKLQKKENPDFDEDKLAEIVGIGALKWNDLKRDSKQDIIFDWDDILNMEGNSGPYLQYTYARTQSVLRKAEGEGQRVETDVASSKYKVASINYEQEEELLMRLLYRFEETVIEAAEKYSPNILCSYLFVLAQTFNLFYQKHQILSSENDTKNFRLALTDVVGKTIKKGLNLLGIKAPERM